MQTDFIKSSAPEAWDLQGTGSAAGAGGGSSSAGSAVNTQDTSQNFAGFTDIGSGFEGGNVLFRNSGYLRLGQGDNSVIFDANDALYRVAVGSETYSIAPFRVQKDGKFHAGSSTQYIDWDGTKLTIAGDVVQIDTSTGAVKGSLQNVISLTAGETISGATTPVPVYLASDGKVYKADADSTTPEARTVLGFCITDTTINNSATIQTDGILTVPTITLSETIASTLDQESGLMGSGTVSATLNSTTQYFSSGFKTGQNTGNISSVELVTDFSVIGTQTRVVDIYAMASDGKPTGAALGTSNGVTSTVSGWHTYTFSTPVTVTPNTNYCLVVRISSYTSGTVRFYGRQYAYYIHPLPTGLTYDSINSGSTWTNANFNSLAMRIYTTNYTAQTFYPLYLSNTAGSYSIQPSATQDATHQPIATIISSTQIKIGWELDNKFLAYYNPTPTAVVTSAEQYMHTPKYATTAYCNIAWDGSNQKYGFFILKKHEMTPVSIIDDTGGATEYAITGTWTNSLITLVNGDGTASPFSTIKIYFYS